MGPSAAIRAMVGRMAGGALLVKPGRVCVLRFNVRHDSKSWKMRNQGKQLKGKPHRNHVPTTKEKLPYIGAISKRHVHHTPAAVPDSARWVIPVATARSQARKGSQSRDA